MKFKLNLLPQDEETELGESHFLGCPDVPAIWNEQAEFYNDEIFLGQINLEQHPIDNLPKKGMIYFFLAIESRPYRPIVRYSSDMDNLERIDFNSEIDFPFDLDKEYSLSNDGDDVKLLEDAPIFKHYHLKKGDKVLLDLSEDPMNIFGNLDDKLCLIISEEDLKQQNFKNVKISFMLEE